LPLALELEVIETQSDAKALESTCQTTTKKQVGARGTMADHFFSPKPRRSSSFW
jgi:hypothetical protein